MTNESKKDFLGLIKEHGLTIRQIPLVTTGTYDAIHYENALKHKKENENIGEPYQYTFKNGKIRTFFNVTRIPKNAGFWLCKKSEESAMTPWFWKDSVMAPTLEESILLYLESQKQTKGVTP